MTATEFLLQAIFLDPEQARTALDTWLAVTDLDVLPFDQFELLPLLVTRLETLGVETPWPGRLRGVYRKAWYAHQLGLQSARDLAQDLASAGIGPSVLKLARPPGGERLTERPRLALPFVVPVVHIQAALRRLGELGWRPKPDDERIGSAAYFTWRSSLRLKSASGQQILLRWHFLEDWPGDAVDRAFLQRTLALEADDPVLLAMDPTAMLAAATSMGITYPPALADAGLILQNGVTVDWEWIEWLARTAQVERPFAAALKFLGCSLCLPVPSRWMTDPGTPKTSQAPEVNRIAPASLSRPARLQRHWQRFRRLSQALGMLPSPLRFLEYLQYRIQAA